MTSDVVLLRLYAKHRSEEAFAELLRRHADMVYAVALRNVGGDAHLAKDVVQQVFIDLARKSREVSKRQVIGGWLFRSSQFAAAKAVRTERRRRGREQEAQLMAENVTKAGGDADTDWQQLAPTLDSLLAALSDADRDAVWLRCMAGLRYEEIGTQLGISENAARMRVERALQRLRKILARGGVTSTAEAIASAFAHEPSVSISPEHVSAVLKSVLASGSGWASFLTGSVAAGLAVFLLGGAALGAAARWSLPEDTINGSEPTATSRVLWASGVTRAINGVRNVTGGGNSAAERGESPADDPVTEILREVGLKPASDDRFIGPSWLFVAAPQAVLLRSQKFVDLSLEAREWQVDEACAALFARLGLPVATIDQVRRTMAEMLHARFEIYHLGLAEDPPLDNAFISARIRASDDIFRTRLRREIGIDRFETFESFFDTFATRQSMGTLFTTIGAKTDPLTATQEDLLVNAYRELSLGLEPAPIRQGALSAEQLRLFDDWMEQRNALIPPELRARMEQANRERLELLRERSPLSVSLPIYERASEISNR